MIRCTLELLPGGIGEPEHLGTILIDNRIRTTIESAGKRGDYGYRLKKKRKSVWVADGVVADFPRLSYHPWNLVKRILDDAAKKNGGTI